MARWWKAFETQEERKAWEKEEKQENPCFKVCMRMTARQLENDMGFPQGYTAPNKYVTVYRYDWKNRGETA